MSDQPPPTPSVESVDDLLVERASLIRQLANAKRTAGVSGPRAPRWAMTAVVLALVTIVFGTGFGLYYQQAQTSHQNQLNYSECQTRNANAATAKRLYETLARDATSETFRLDFATAAASLRTQDCNVYR